MSRILLVEDSPTQVQIVAGSLARAEYDIHSVDRLDEAIRLTERGTFEAVILDLSLPDSDGLNTYLQMQESAPRTPIVVLTSMDDEELALEMLRRGAQDYLIKGEVTSEWIIRSVRYAVERSHAARSTRGENTTTTLDRKLAMETELVGDILVLRLQEKQLFGETLADQLSSQLFKLVDEDGHRKFILNCGEVDYISNSVLGKLLLWDNKIRQHGGGVRISDLRPEVQEQIKARRLLAQFDICLDEETALRSF